MATVQRDVSSADAWECPKPDAAIWGAASVHGSYYVLHFDISTIIFPYSAKLKKKVRVVCPRHAIHLMHESGIQMTFRVYKHQKTWFYADSRDASSTFKKPAKDRESMIREIARLLFGGSYAAAETFLIELTGVSGW